MKKLLFIMILWSLFILISCNENSTINEPLENETSKQEVATWNPWNPTPEEVYNNLENADFFVIENNVVCVRQADNDWVQNLDFNEAEKVGEIKRSEIHKDWEIWDATILKVGTEIFMHTQRHEAYMAILENGEKIYYCAWLEG